MEFCSGLSGEHGVSFWFENNVGMGRNPGGVGSMIKGGNVHENDV